MPASFRSFLSNLGYNGVICYPSFNNHSIEAWPQDRIEKISNTIDSLNPFEEKRDYFATSVLSESENLQFDTEGRVSISQKLLNHAKIKNNILFKEKVNNFKYTGCQIFNKDIISHKQLNYFPVSEIWDTLLRDSKLYGYEHKGEFKHLTDYEIYEKLFI